MPHNYSWRQENRLRFRDNQQFTTGQVAAICQVAPRTVCKWFNDGRLGGFRIPGSEDRRIPRAELLKFLKANNMAHLLEFLGEGGRRILAVGCNGLGEKLAAHMVGVPVRSEAGAFGAGIAFHDDWPSAVVVDAGEVGFEETLDLVTSANARQPRPWVAVLVPEDWSYERRQRLRNAGADWVLQSPTVVEHLAKLLTEGNADGH